MVWWTAQKTGSTHIPSGGSAVPSPPFPGRQKSLARSFRPLHPGHTASVGDCGAGTVGRPASRAEFKSSSSTHTLHIPSSKKRQRQLPSCGQRLPPSHGTRPWEEKQARPADTAKAGAPSQQPVQCHSSSAPRGSPKDLLTQQNTALSLRMSCCV